MQLPRALLLLGASTLVCGGSPARFPEAVIAARAEAALLGMIVSDAAAMPLHWQYSQAAIKRLVGAGSPEFFSPPQNLWYKGKEGGSTPYGQQALAYLAVGGQPGGFQPAAVQDAYWALYNPATCPGPSGGWYLDGSTKEFVQNYQGGQRYPHSGGNDAQADAAAHAVIVAALLGGNTSALLDALEPVIRVTQDTAEAAAFGAAAARLFERLLVYNYSSPAAAVADTVADLRSASRAHPFTQDAAMADAMEAAAAAAASGEASASFILRTGQSCDYFFTLPNVAFLTALLGSGVEDFVSGARQNVRRGPPLFLPLSTAASFSHSFSLPPPPPPLSTLRAAQILAGGDSGSRGCFLGAIQGARLGDKALLPADWVAKTTAYAQVLPLAAALVARRGA